MSIHDEESLLGELLNRPDLLPDVQACVGQSDFSTESGRRAFAWIESAKLTPDGAANVREFLKWAKRDGVTFREHDAGDGLPALRRIVETTTGAHCVYHARRVANDANWRRIADVSDSLTSGLRDRDDKSLDDAEPALRAAAERIGDALTKSARGNSVPIAAAVSDALREIESRLAGQSRMGLPTGFTALDRLLSGLRPGQLVILAARPGQGKSALAANMAANVCDAGGRTLFVSLEMGREELVERMLASHAGVDCGAMRQGNLKHSQRAAVVESSAALAKWQMEFDDRSAMRVHDVIAQARRMQMRGGLDLIVVDYLQLLTPDNPRNPRQEQVATFSRALKGAAKSLQVPILCLAQLNREADAPHEKPRLSHLRESGAIEQDADVVMFIWHEQRAEKPAYGDPAPCKVVVAKQRNGPTGDIDFEWRGNVVTFTEYTRPVERCSFLPGRVEPIGLYDSAGMEDFT